MNRIDFYRWMRKVSLLSASFLITLSSCKKDGELTPDFIENTSSINFIDDIEINSTVRIGDSILADRVSTGLVGYYRDSIFGTTISSIYVQPLLSSNALVFAEPNEVITVDSVVLSLKYNNIFGDTSVDQTIDVFRLSEELESDKLYFSDTNIQTLPSILGTKSFRPNQDKKTTVIRPNSGGGKDTIDLDPQLRIRLDNSLGSEILSKSGQDELSNNTEFTKFFRGLKITPNTSAVPSVNEFAILYFALTASDTKMTIYYNTDDGSSTKLIKSIDFPINSSSVKFNTFKHDFTNSPIENEINNTSLDSSFAYTQSMAGVETAIQFPNLFERFKDKNIVINKAELELSVVGGSYSKFGIPSKLTIAARDEFGNLQFIPDNGVENESYFGGVYDPVDNKYKFNIARYIQGIINGNSSGDGLTILVAGSAVNAGRLVFYSEKSPTNKLKLNLFYSNTQ